MAQPMPEVFTPWRYLTPTFTVVFCVYPGAAIWGGTVRVVRVGAVWVLTITIVFVSTQVQQFELVFWGADASMGQCGLRAASFCPDKVSLILANKSNNVRSKNTGISNDPCIGRRKKNMEADFVLWHFLCLYAGSSI
jgi:hypothetical protein